MQESPEMPQSRANAEAIPESGLTPDELVKGQLAHNLSDDAARKYAAIAEAAVMPGSDIDASIQEFNALSREDRGYDKYNHERPLTENEAHTISVNLPNGKTLQVTMSEKGEVAVSLALNS